MTYTKQEWVDQETVITAARMNHIEGGVEAASESKAAVSYVLNTSPSIPHSSSQSPDGWTPVGEQVPAITYVSGSGFRVNTPGTYLVALSGSYGNGPTSGNMEYRVVHNGSRVLATFGANGDTSTRSGTCVVTAAEGDLIAPDYSQTSGSAVTLRPGSFNTITFVQIS